MGFYFVGFTNLWKMIFPIAIWHKLGTSCDACTILSKMLPPTAKKMRPSWEIADDDKEVASSKDDQAEEIAEDEEGDDSQETRKGRFQVAILAKLPLFSKTILVQKPPVTHPGRILYVYSISFNTETTRTHPGPDPLRLQYR